MRSNFLPRCVPQLMMLRSNFIPSCVPMLRSKNMPSCIPGVPRLLPCAPRIHPCNTATRKTSGRLQLGVVSAYQSDQRNSSASDEWSEAWDLKDLPQGSGVYLVHVTEGITKIGSSGWF